MRHNDSASKLSEELPAGGLLAIVAALEETQRRIREGRSTKPELTFTLELDPKTGDVLEVVVTRRYRRA